METFQDLESSRLRVLRDSAWCLTNIGSASCVGDDQVEDKIIHRKFLLASIVRIMRTQDNV